MTAVKHILRYIYGTLNFGCHYERRGEDEEPCLTGYSDSDMGGDVDDQKSTTGVLYLLGKSMVSWQSHKQKSGGISSCEAEYIAVTTATCQGIWLGRLLSDLMEKEVKKIVLRVENKSAISL